MATLLGWPAFVRITVSDIASIVVACAMDSCPAAQVMTPFDRAPQAAVKAIAWSPHQHGLLASGGGTADRCIRYWNTTTGAALSSIDTGSQARR